MANKKNLPNIPIYIGDWERDCNVLSLQSEAAWMRIVFKLWTKGKQNSIKIPTKSLQNLWRCSEVEMNDILNDLIYNEIAEISINSGFVEFTCRRFVKENIISEIRSEASKGNKKSKKYKTKPKQTSNKNEQNTESDDDYDIDNEIVNNYKVEIYPTFDDFWDEYDKKVGSKSKIKKQWDKLNQKTKEEIMVYIPNYKLSQPEKKYRKNPETFFNNESWNDEIILTNGKQQQINGQQGGASQAFREKVFKGLTNIQPD
tara:strand:- start:3190 stop:3963 length:774 start_codon:yes stop_codon:yes gene_type:complete